MKTLLVAACVMLGGCTNLLGDFTYDPSGHNGMSNGISQDDQKDIVVLPTSGLITTEQGGKDHFSIFLKRQPKDGAVVVIGLSSSNDKEGTVSPSSVTFTPDNYAAPQVVQVTGVDDNVADHTQSYAIKTSPATSSDLSYFGLDPIDPTVQNVDDETAGFLLTPPSGLVTSESGGEAKFTLALTHQPTGDVTIPLSSSKPTEGTVSPQQLVFTKDNWMAPQTVTVTGVNDDVPDMAQQYSIVTGAAVSGDTGYDKLDPPDELVTNLDNDSVGVTLSPETGLLTYENGGMATFTIVLNSPPGADVLIPLSSNKLSEGTVSPASVSFTNDNWMAPQTVTVTGVDDTRVDGNQPYKIVTDPCQSNGAYNGFNPDDAELLNVDDDTPGLLVSPKEGLLTGEDGTMAQFGVSLQSKPSGNVLINLTSSRPSEGVVTPAQLTFTEVNWNAPQTVTVTGVDDKVADGMQPYTVSVTPDPASADGKYAALIEVDVALSNTDDDSAGIRVVATPNATTSEWGGWASFTVVLNSQPTADVIIPLTSSDTSEGSVSPAQLVFTSANYNAPQTVTVTGVNDDAQDGNQPYRVSTEAAISKDLNYSGLDAANVDFSNIDDDSAGISVNAPNQPLSTSESGGSVTFTVVLNSKPTGSVTIPVSSTNAGEGSVNVASLTFTMDNWRAPQTVTVKGVEDDGTADGSQQYRIKLDVAKSDDPHYAGMDPPDVTLVNTDNDSPGITLKNAGNLSTNENGSSATFQIVLNSKPTADVSIALSSSRTSEGVVTPAMLKFTGANWNAPQTVTVTGVDDKVADGNQVYRVVTAAASSSDGKYNGVDAADAQVTNVDNDSPGVSVAYMPKTGLVSIEGGSPVSFTVALNSQPTADVMIAVHSNKMAEGTVNPTSLTFTSVNWNAPHTVTVTPGDDKVADGDQPYLVVLDAATSTDPKYNGIDAPDVPVTNVDNDSPGVSVTAISGNTTENGPDQFFYISLNSQPTADVTVTISSSNTKEGVVSPSSVIFTSTNYAGQQKITVSSVDDKVVDGDQPYTIQIAPAVSKDAKYNGVDAPDISLTNVDDDSAGVTISSPTNTSKTYEVGLPPSGMPTTFTLRLNSQPTGDVTIPIASSNTAEGTVSVSSLVFTANNWSATKTITVTGVDDDAVDGNQPYKVVIGAAQSTDPNYNKLDAPDVDLQNVDNDSADFNISPTSGTTSEKPGSLPFSFKVSLSSKPTADVTLSFSSSNTKEGTVSTDSLTFTSINWNAAQTVNVTGVNDDVVDGSQGYAIKFGAATSTDPNYKGLIPSVQISLQNADDDSAGINVNTTGLKSTSETGTSTTFSVVLNSQPKDDVTIPLTSNDTTECSVSPSSLTFTAMDWNKPQTVTVHGEDDKIDDGDQTVTIVTGAATSTDKNYDGLNADDVTVTNVDNDTAGIDVSLVGMAVTTEAGGSAKVAVVLNSQPKAAVSIPVSTSDSGEGTADVTKLDFTTGNWSVAQYVTITGVDDSVADGDQMYQLVLGKPTSTDTSYAAIDPADVTLTNTDNDMAGIEVTPPAANMAFTTEAMGMATFSVVLHSAPKSSVTIPLGSSDETEGTILDPPAGKLVFDKSNWNKAQMVTVVGVDDPDVDGDQDYTISIGPSTSGDAAYDKITKTPISLTNLDDD